MIDLTSNHPLPIYGVDLPRHGIQLAGSETVQRDLSGRAQRMVEAYRMHPDAPLCTRPSLGWIEAQGWQVLLLPGQMSEEQDEQLAVALRRRGHETLIGATVGPDPSERAAAFRFPTTAENMVNFRLAHSGHLTLTFPEDRSMMLHYDSDSIVLAGSPDFLRDAVPERAALRAEVEKEEQVFRATFQGEWLGPLIRRYEAVTLRD